MDKQGPRDVDAYIASAPAAAQPHLRTLRAIVKSEAPGAEERLSYGMPHYDHHGPAGLLRGQQGPRRRPGHAQVRVRSGLSDRGAARRCQRTVDENEALALANSRRPAR
jgi:Domain of unknown function (DU1801)